MANFFARLAVKFSHEHDSRVSPSQQHLATYRVRAFGNIPWITLLLSARAWGAKLGQRYSRVKTRQKGKAFFIFVALPNFWHCANLMHAIRREDTALWWGVIWRWLQWSEMGLNGKFYIYCLDTCTSQINFGMFSYRDFAIMQPNLFLVILILIKGQSNRIVFLWLQFVRFETIDALKWVVGDKINQCARFSELLWKLFIDFWHLLFNYKRIADSLLTFLHIEHFCCFLQQLTINHEHEVHPPSAVNAGKYCFRVFRINFSVFISVVEPEP